MGSERNDLSYLLTVPPLSDTVWSQVALMGRMGSLVEIRRTLDLGEALCIKAFVNAREIYTFVQNEHHITQSSGMLSLALGGFRIVVAAEDAAEARRVLADADAGEFALQEDFDDSSISTSLW